MKELWFDYPEQSEEIDKFIAENESRIISKIHYVDLGKFFIACLESE